MAEFQYLPAVAFFLSFISINLVLVQLHDQMKQRKIDADIRISDINRQLIILGFAYPALFEVLNGETNDPVAERRYLQLWFNQFDLIYTYKVRGLFSNEVRESLEHDIRDFLKPQNVQRHWREFRQFYPASFQNFVNSLLPEQDRADS